MKQLLSILLITFSIFGCSSDDSNTSTDKQLKKITSFTIKDGKERKTAEQFFENGKEISGIYSDADDPLLYTNTYNKAGLLIKTQERLASSENINTTIEYTYDEKNRLLKITRSSFSFKNTRDFIYNTDNTITRIPSSTDIIGNQTTYYLNDNGLIFKEITSFGNKDDSTFSERETQVTYKNNLIVNLISDVSSLSENREYFFEYNEKIKPKGGVNTELNKFGSKNNIILSSFSLLTSSVPAHSEEFITKISRTDLETTTTYTFDNNEYLIKSETFIDGKKVRFSDYQYN